MTSATAPPKTRNASKVGLPRPGGIVPPSRLDGCTTAVTMALRHHHGHTSSATTATIASAPRSASQT